MTDKPGDITEDGYVVVPARPEPAIKGQCCGLCGAKFDFGKAYGFVCGKALCPIFTKMTY